MENPYQDTKDLSAWKWMMKHHKKGIILSFLFIGIFMVAPWIGPYKVEQLWLALLITGCMTALNFLATWLHPYLIYKRNLKNWKRWEYNHNKKDK